MIQISRQPSEKHFLVFTLLYFLLKLTPIFSSIITKFAAPKTRRSRKILPSSTEDAADSASEPAASTSTLHRLHGTSDTLRALLERRAERQQRQMSSSDTSTPAPPLTTRAPIETSSPSPTATAATPTTRNKVKVRFWLQFRVEYGQSLVVVGGSPELGAWILADGLPLTWSESDMWNASVDLPAGTVTEYKYVVVGQGGHAVAWQHVVQRANAKDLLGLDEHWRA